MFYGRERDRSGSGPQIHDQRYLATQTLIDPDDTMADNIYAIPRVRAPGFLALSGNEGVEPKASEFDVTSFVRKYQDVVVNTCNHFLRDMDESYDLAQQIFMAALTVSGRITTDTEWRAWTASGSGSDALSRIR